MYGKKEIKMYGERRDDGNRENRVTKVCRETRTWKE